MRFIIPIVHYEIYNTFIGLYCCRRSLWNGGLSGDTQTPLCLLIVLPIGCRFFVLALLIWHGGWPAIIIRNITISTLVIAFMLCGYWKDRNSFEYTLNGAWPCSEMKWPFVFKLGWLVKEDIMVWNFQYVPWRHNANLYCITTSQWNLSVLIGISITVTNYYQQDFQNIHL